MSQIKVCPHCGSRMFVGAITRGCAIESIIDENGNPNFNVIKESSGDKYDLEILKCCRCKKDIKTDELIEGVQCKECGRIVNPDELNEEGICEVCVAVKKRSDIANASREELILMLLNAEKQVNPITAHVEKQIKKAESIDDKKDIIDINSKDEKSTSKKTNKRNKVKTNENPESNNVKNNKADEKSKDKEMPVTNEEVTEAITDIATQQEAPFPEVMESELQIAASTQENAQSSTNLQQPTASTEGFTMFDDKDDEQF